MDYASIIQERFAVKEKQEEKYRSVYSFLANPNINGIDLKFTNQIPSNSDLEHPIRTYNTPRTYAQNDFFSIFTATTDHIINAGKAVLYNRQDATARAKNCNVQ